jgi:hypothetical protein
VQTGVKSAGCEKRITHLLLKSDNLILRARYTESRSSPSFEISSVETHGELYIIEVPD